MDLGIPKCAITKCSNKLKINPQTLKDSSNQRTSIHSNTVSK
jgi:hypothetical protein